MTLATLDSDKVMAFGEKMTDVLNGGALGLMCSIGYRTRLFDTMAEMPPASSETIAEVAGLNARYVREWLNAMVAGRIVEYDPELETYWLPAEHAALLTRAVGADNLALYAQHLGGLGSVETQIVDCFTNGGGVDYPAFVRFHEVMAEDSGVNIVDPLIEKILPLAPGLIEALEKGIRVLDVGCGRGLAMQKLAHSFPQSHFTGIDFSAEAIEVAQAMAEQAHLQNVDFLRLDAAQLAEKSAFELVTAFDAIHDQAQPLTVLKNIYRALRPRGTFLMQDIAASSHVERNLDRPLAPFLYTLSTMHCMTVSLAHEGEGLGTMWGQEKALDYLQQAGFTNTEVKQLPHDIFNDYYISTKE